MRRHSQGAVLGVVIITALVCSIAAYAVLMIAVSRAKHAKFFRARTQARYLAEAAIVMAREQLWATPAWCGGTVLVDTNGDQLGDKSVGVTVTPCPGPGVRSVIQATVNN